MISIIHFNSWCLLFPLMFQLTLGEQFCATFDSIDAAGATGWFNMNINNGTAVYSFSIDLTNYDEGSCDLSSGMSYHIHTYWNNNSVSSGANAYCGLSYTGNHFDPNLACSQASEDSGSGGLCEDLGRTATSTPPYEYSCNTSNYENGRYAFCEVGDLSGKFGATTSTGRVYEELTGYIDYQPPYIANFKQGDAVSHQWQSIVFHCKNGGARLVCAELVESDECGVVPLSDKSDDDDEWSINEWNTLTKILLSVGVVLVAGLLIGGLVLTNRGWMKSRGDDNSNLL
mmetsp:Transcript_3963/g.6202  ORF Transcript_3963/g.6202 Transcript_3963/m.6202 type:complete len:286 (-) Transcript_3963:202-1059(-)|eukprot:CAMPEP_0185022378 /NCGR_PEP_ID=MMETSP1103-20130426/5096_1 /TAXON_ID=36769 /ORGANISM="Paraphysomonas bandaiensis, Strain Caron Lab Isolate" /LENGTH=285 /DNA_ID=CAMNT_0027554425 /DNA_START=81 /DNA_END=938 /DNA_ORIENTATION=+